MEIYSLSKHLVGTQLPINGRINLEIDFGHVTQDYSRTLFYEATFVASNNAFVSKLPVVGETKLIEDTDGGDPAGIQVPFAINVINDEDRVFISDHRAR